MKHKQKSQRGFTLIELMVVVALIGIFASMAVPSFISTVKRSEVSKLSSNWLRLVKIARSEAITRRTTVIACPASAVGANTCSSSGNDWKNGWVLFVESNTNKIRDSAEEVLGLGEAFNHTKKPRLMSADSGAELTGITALVFDPSGQLTVIGATPTLPLVVRVCDPDNKVDGADIRISRIGTSIQKTFGAGKSCDTTPVE